MAVMNQSRRDAVANLLDHVAGQCTLLRDASSDLLKTSARHDYIEHMIDLRDTLKQVSELIEETIKVKA